MGVLFFNIQFQRRPQNLFKIKGGPGRGSKKLKSREEIPTSAAKSLIEIEIYNFYFFRATHILLMWQKI